MGHARAGGFLGDRSYLAYDPETYTRITNKPVTGCPELMRIRAVRGDLRPVLLFHDEHGTQRSRYDLGPLNWYRGEAVDIDEFGDRVPCRDMGDEPAQVLSEFLGRSVRMAIKFLDWLAAKPGTIPPAERRQAPLHIISRASVDALQERLQTEEDLSYRFRPNLVIGGPGEFDMEQAWRRLRIGQAIIKNLRPTLRCEVPGRRPDNGKPMKDIPKLYRDFAKGPNDRGQLKPIKGIYAALESTENIEVHVGDTVEVIE